MVPPTAGVAPAASRPSGPANSTAAPAQTQSRPATGVGSLVYSRAALCVICQDGMHAGEDALFVGPCGHTFHVQCAESNFVVGGQTSCPLCRAPFGHAPGFIAMARAEARTRSRDAFSPLYGPQAGAGFNFGRSRHASPTLGDHAPTEFSVLPEVTATAATNAAPAGGPAHPPVRPDFAKSTILTDVGSLKPGRATLVTALISVKYADDDDSAPVQVPTDFVLLADISGSMSGGKLSSLKDALMKLSTMFGPHDRVALVSFSNEAQQLTPLAPISDPDHGAAFRRASMMLGADGGTNITRALGAARAVMGARASDHRNPSAQVLLLTDGQDSEAMHAPALPDGVCVCTLGFGEDHDAELLASVAGRSVPRGTFTFVQHNHLLDETLAGYIGDVTRVLTVQTTLVLAPKPGTITTIQRVINPPGPVRHLVSGAVEIDLGMARVDGALELMVELMVAPPAQASSYEALSVRVAGTAVLGATAVKTKPAVLRFTVIDAPGSGAPPPTNARIADAMAAAHNRERVAVAASALVNVSTAAVASDIIEAARSVMQGPQTARADAEQQLDDLERNISQLEVMRIVATETTAGMSAGFGSLATPSKGAQTAIRVMQQMKASSAAPVLRPPPPS